MNEYEKIRLCDLLIDFLTRKTAPYMGMGMQSSVFEEMTIDQKTNYTKLLTDIQTLVRKRDELINEAATKIGCTLTCDIKSI